MEIEAKITKEMGTPESAEIDETRRKRHGDVKKGLAKKRMQFANEVSRYQRRMDWCAALRRKYERAAAHPWLAVDQDPPEPEL